MKYDDKINAKKERYEQLSTQAAEKSSECAGNSINMLSGLGAGQPILVGHHSEVKHRRLLERSDNAMRRAVEEDKKSRYYAEKAASVGTAGISSDDENAIEKLNDKLQSLVKMQDKMKLINKQYKKGGWDAITAVPETEVKQLKQKLALFTYYPKPYPSFELTNNNARINATKMRLAALQRMKTIEVKTEDYDTFVFRVEDNRVQFVFEGKPEQKVREVLKRHAFKWSPTRGAWVRQLTQNALYSAKIVKKELLAL